MEPQNVVNINGFVRAEDAARLAVSYALEAECYEDSRLTFEYFMQASALWSRIATMLAVTGPVQAGSGYLHTGQGAPRPGVVPEDNTCSLHRQL